MAFDLWNIGGALLGGLMGGGDQEQTSTAKSEPWSYAQPWMIDNIESGKRLQEHYQQNPFSTQQEKAYGNSFGLSDRVRALAPSLVTQMSSRVPFDRTNPLARPAAYNFSAAAPSAAPAAAPGASTGASGSVLGTNPFSGSWRPPAPVSAAPAGPGVFDWATGSGGPGGAVPPGVAPGAFRLDGRSYTMGILPALLGVGKNMAPVVDQWGGSVGSDGGYGGFGGQTGGDGALGFGGVY